MKNLLIGGLAVLVVALALGVEPIERVINEIASKGTLRGVETCLRYSKSELLSDDAVRAACVQTFQTRPPSIEFVTGPAGPRMDQGKVSWGGTLENQRSDYVVTWIEIGVIIFDAEGNKEETFAGTPIWIDPLGKTEFKIDLPDLDVKRLETIEFCDRDQLSPKACMDWGISDVMALSI